jgi:O-antigen/teichoic acid export membrane protein
VILLAITLIGIPLLPLVGLSIAIVILLGTLGVVLWIGERVAHQPGRTRIQQFLLGILILAFIGFIPILGGIILSAINLVGFGAVLALWLSKPQARPTG